MRTRRLYAVLACVAVGAGVGLWVAQGEQVAPEPTPAVPKPELAAPPLPAPVPAPSPEPGVELEHQRAPFSGLVVDAKGNPVAGAEVTAFAQLDSLHPEVDCLKSLPSMFGMMMMPTLSCGCSENAAGVTKLLQGLTAPPVLDGATTGPDGRFVLNLPERKAASLHAKRGALRASAAKVEGAKLVLGPLVELKGRVVDDAQRGVAGARVVIVDDALTELTTDENGEFRSMQTDGPKQIIAAKEGLLPDLTVWGVAMARSQRMMPMRQPNELTLELGKATTFTGKVVHAGKGVAGVEVRQQMVPCAAKAVTEADGTFTLRDMREQAYVFVARSGSSVGEVRTKSVYGPVEIELNDEVVVRGTVKGEGGSALKFAWVQVEDPRDPHSAVSGSGYVKDDGTYELGPIPAGAYRLRARAEGWSDSVREVTLSLKEPVVQLDLTLARGLGVSGRVVDESGQPVEHASLEALEGTVTERRFTFVQATLTTSREAGVFELGGLPEGDFTLAVRGQGYLERFVPVRAGATGVNVTLLRGARLVGTLTTASGALAPHATVTAYLLADEEGKRTPQNRTISFGGVQPTGSDWQLENLRGGEYRVYAREDAREVEQVVKVRHGESARVDLKLPDGRAVVGRIVDEQGVPMKGASVAAGSRPFGLPAGLRMPGVPQSIVTDPDGRFELTGLVGTKVNVVAEREGYQTAQLEVALSSREPVQLRLVKLPSLTGRVLGPDGLPVKSFRIGAAQQQVSADDGRFSIVREQGATQQIVVRAPGLAALTQTVQLPAQGSAHVGDLRMKAGRAARGKVTDAQGAPVAGVLVQCKDRGCDAVNSDRSGAFGLNGLPEGDVVLDVWTHGFRKQEPVLPAGASTLDIVLDPGFTLRGALRDESGKPMRDVTLWLTGSAVDSHNWTARTGSGGAFEIHALQVGTLEIDAHEAAVKMTVEIVRDGQQVELRATPKPAPQ